MDDKGKIEKYLLPEFTRGRVLEIGSDGVRTFPHFIMASEYDGDDRFDTVVLRGGKSELSLESCTDLVKWDGYVIHLTDDFKVYRNSKSRGLVEIDCKRPSKSACVVRYGGFGDMIQTALILPRLKEQGYHVTVMTTPKGQDILQHDPHIDAWYIVDTDQVPNHELHDFWNVQALRFDKFIQLSESIEGQLLALPGRPNHTWPYQIRKKRMNTNYHEWTAELAEVSFRACKLFYASMEERAGALARIAEHGSGCFNVMWALSGSSQHKFTPHMDAVIARMLLDMPEARIFLVGDMACKILEQGWEEENRVISLSDQMTIRETLALAELSNLVIGPETGVLNAVGFSETPSKVLLLSHSSANNLSKHWRNVQALVPDNCACYPCHRLHYNTDYCSIVEDTGAALCAQNIGAEVIYAAVHKVYQKWRRA